MKTFFTIAIGLLLACSSDGRRTPASGDPGDPDEGDSLDGLVRTGGGSGATRLHPSSARDGGSGEPLDGASEPLDGVSEPLADASEPLDGGGPTIEDERRKLIGTWRYIKVPHPCGAAVTADTLIECSELTPGWTPDCSKEITIGGDYLLVPAGFDFMGWEENVWFGTRVRVAFWLTPQRVEYDTALRLWLVDDNTLLGSEWHELSNSGMQPLCLAWRAARVMP